MSQDHKSPFDAVPTVSWEQSPTSTPADDIRRTVEAIRKISKPFAESSPQPTPLEVVAMRCLSAAELTFALFLVRLNEYIAAGEGDSREADELRDRMDHPWSRMDEDGRQRMRDLSVELERLEGR